MYILKKLRSLKKTKNAKKSAKIASSKNFSLEKFETWHVSERTEGEISRNYTNNAEKKMTFLFVFA